MGEKIRLSLVIAAFNTSSHLQRCLSAIAVQWQEQIEVIVVSNHPREIAGVVGEFPFVQCIEATAETIVPQLRTLGVAQAKGEIIALLEDHCWIATDWCQTMLAAHDELPYAAIGGCIENASCQRALDCAVYFYDYGKYMKPRAAAVADTLCGNNVSYKRAMLERVAASYRDGFFATFVHLELQRQGLSLYLLPHAVVYHDKSYSAHYAIHHCFHSGRSYGGMRLANGPFAKRMLFAAACAILPGLLSMRIISGIMHKKRRWSELLRSLPWLAILLCSWSLGEFVGYVLGVGNSSAHWK